jgi:hypothetical protein
MPDLIKIALDENNTLAITNEIDLAELSSANRMRLYYAMEKYAAVGRLVEEEKTGQIDTGIHD